MENLKDTVMKEAANNAAILDCYRRVATNAVRELVEKKRKIAELEAIIHNLKSQQKQPA